MSWTYRVIRRIDADGVTPFFCITETFNEKTDSFSYAADPVHPIGDTADALRDDLERMLKAFKKPIMNERPDGVLEDDWTP